MVEKLSVSAEFLIDDHLSFKEHIQYAVKIETLNLETSLSFFCCVKHKLKATTCFLVENVNVLYMNTCVHCLHMLNSG